MARQSALDDGIVVVGTKRHPVRDAYHSLLRMTWPAVLVTIALLFLAANALFAVLFMEVGEFFLCQDDDRSFAAGEL